MPWTIQEAKELFGGGQSQASVFDCFVGKYCICRATGAGVHAGRVKAVQPNGQGTHSVVLTNARRMWSWQAKSGVALSGAAVNGIERSKSKIDTAVLEHAIDGVCEIIPCTSVGEESIHGA